MVLHLVRPTPYLSGGPGRMMDARADGPDKYPWEFRPLNPGEHLEGLWMRPAVALYLASTMAPSPEAMVELETLADGMIDRGPLPLQWRMENQRKYREEIMKRGISLPPECGL